MKQGVTRRKAGNGWEESEARSAGERDEGPKSTHRIKTVNLRLRIPDTY
jgi:hypothetical protein